MRARTFLMAAAMGLLLAACGGGSAASSPPAAPQLQAPTLSWPEPAAISWGTALSAAQLNATANVAGSFSYSPAAGAKPEVGTQTLTVTFTPQDTSRYSSATASRALSVGKAYASLRWEPPAAVVQGSALTPTTLSTAPYAQYGVQGSIDPTSYGTVDGKALSTATAAVGSVAIQGRFVPQDTTHYQAGWISTLLTVKPATAQAAVDFGSARQTIQGFGGSAAWYYTKLADERLNLLFGSQLADSLGLNILRLRIAPAAWNATAGTADTSQWTAELANATAAQARGALVFASSWSPPASLKIVNAERKDPLWSGRLNPALHADYAKYLNAYIRYAASRGVELYAISPQNEPDWDPTDYESCLWNAEELRSFAAVQGAAVVAGSKTRLMLPESLNFNPATTEALLADAKAAANIAIIGGHLYGGAHAYPSSAVKQGKDVWMTEHFLDSVNKADGKASWSTTVDDAIAIAREIHDGLTLSQYNAYVHWWLVNSSDAKPTGLINSGDGKPTHFGLGMKHFSYFVRPGYVRYDSSSRPLKGVLLSAYGTAPGAAESKAVVVIVNENSEALTLTTSLNAAGRTLTSWTPYRTTASTSFERLAPITMAGDSLTITLPAKSITTLRSPSP